MWNILLLFRSRWEQPPRWANWIPASAGMTTQGFSLLEIMIAVAILSASVMTLMSAQGSSFLGSERAERLTQATLLARAKMSEMEIEFQKDLAKNKFPEDDVSAEGEFEEPFNDFRWSSTIKKVEIPVVDTGSLSEGQASEGEASEASENVLVSNYVKNVMDQISKAVRQVSMTIYWGDKDKPLENQPHYTVTTHWVKLK